MADKRGEQRFGYARNDDANPSELAPGDADNEDDDSPSGDDLELAAAEAAGEIEGGTEHAGMGRNQDRIKSRTHDKSSRTRDKSSRAHDKSGTRDKSRSRAKSSKSSESKSSKSG